jgi:hypothetical protein
VDLAVRNEDHQEVRHRSEEHTECNGPASGPELLKYVPAGQVSGGTT